jgi:hypothetical protein
MLFSRGLEALGRERSRTVAFAALFVTFNLTVLAFVDACMNQVFAVEREGASDFLSKLGLGMYVADPWWFALMVISAGAGLLSAAALTLGDVAGYSREDVAAFVGIPFTTLALFASGIFDLASATWIDWLNRRPLQWPHWTDAWWLGGNPFISFTAKFFQCGISFYPVIATTSMVGVAFIIAYWAWYYFLS